MNLILPFVVGALVAAGLYMMMRRSSIKLLIGFALLSHGANLLVFSAGGLVRGGAPLIEQGESLPPAAHADPLPQALVLTAMVISFGVLAFAIALVLRTYRETKTDDVDKMTTTER
ncbi:MAG: Na+/H+ antiporter subunit C [Planctomycetota bacterium]|nr:MAG: Na+/H+ antiporter subunit C [Planctomycetota bacterium]